jgi:hypothetical protein
MFAACLGKSLTAEAQARPLTYRNKYTFDGVEYAPLKYKIIMRLATRKEEQSPTAGGNSATYAAAAVSFANPQFQALVASMQGRFNED